MNLMDFAQFSLQISLVGIVSLISLFLGLLWGVHKYPNVLNANVRNPLNGEGLFSVEDLDNSKQTPFFGCLTKEELRDWCTIEQEKVVHKIGEQTENSIHVALNGWKASTNKRLENIEKLLKLLLNKAMDHE